MFCFHAVSNKFKGFWEVLVILVEEWHVGDIVCVCFDPLFWHCGGLWYYCFDGTLGIGTGNGLSLFNWPLVVVLVFLGRSLSLCPSSRTATLTHTPIPHTNITTMLRFCGSCEAGRVRHTSWEWGWVWGCKCEGQGGHHTHSSHDGKSVVLRESWSAIFHPSLVSFPLVPPFLSLPLSLFLSAFTTLAACDPQAWRC